MARNVHLVGCGFLVKLQRSTVSTWIGISVKTAERRTAGEWHTGSGTLLLRTGLITKRYRIQTKEVAFWRLHRQCLVIFFFSGDSLKFFCTPFSSRWEEKSKNKKKQTHIHTHKWKQLKNPNIRIKQRLFMDSVSGKTDETHRTRYATDNYCLYIRGSWCMPYAYNLILKNDFVGR